MNKYAVTIRTGVDIRYHFEHTYYVNAASGEVAEREAYKKAKAASYEGICDIVSTDDILLNCKELDRSVEIITSEAHHGTTQPERVNATEALLRDHWSDQVET